MSGKDYLKSFKAWLIILLALLGILLQSEAQALTINVVGDNGLPIGSGFRYLIEEDNSWFTTPGVGTPTADWNPGPVGATPDQVQALNPTHTLAVNIHKSHAPVVCSGDTGMVGGAATANTASNPDCVLDPAKHYQVSVIPWHLNPGYPPNPPNYAAPWFANQPGYTMSGRNVGPGQASVTIVVHDLPIPTAQITVLVFKDNEPINAALDQPAESGLPRFSLLVTDIIGKMMQDAWGNPLGTTYQIIRDGSGRPIKTANGQYQFILDPTTGVPVVDYMGNGSLWSCPSGDAAYDAANCVDLDTGVPLNAGEAVIRFLAPNKYTVQPLPPANDPDWILTGTFEGTKGNDAWVRAGEPRFNIQLGQLNWLVPFGFVKRMNPISLPGGTGTIRGQVVWAHDMHPPLAPGLSVGTPVPNCYIGLNNLSGNDEQVYTDKCNADSTFQINSVPPGSYQLAIWDKEINAIIDFRSLVISSAGQTLDLGQVAIYRWFGILQGSVFADTNGDGLRQSTERGIPQQRVNARFTDGSVYASQLTDANGNYNFGQYFPWWRWLVAEIDPGNSPAPEPVSPLKSTGMTAVIDDGGPLTNTSVYPGTGQTYAAMGIFPQIQPGGLPYRTQKSVPGDEVFTQAVNVFSDMTNIIDWGRTSYPAGENGGIKGFVSYATSRTQEDPESSFWQSGWEPGIPKVQINLYGAMKDPTTGLWVRANCTGGSFTTPPTSCTPCTTNCTIIQTVYTDSFDEENPTGCVSTNSTLWPNPQIVNGHKIRDCAETFRTWDQTRPGVFDGAYAFNTTCVGTINPDGTCAGTVKQGLPLGDYVVEAVVPTGYKLLKWGDRNIEFGEPNAPFQIPSPECVGPNYAVSEFHQLFPDWQIPYSVYPQGQWYCNGGAIDASGFCTVGGIPTTDPAIGPVAPSCSMKHVPVAQGKNTVVDFRMFTDVPKSVRIWGWVSDDLHLESNPNSPNASSNFAPSWVPVSIQDWKGSEVARLYTDQWGKFNGLVPSTYTIYTPNPLGMSSGLYTIFPNDPGPVLDTRAGSPTLGQYITDPFFNPGLGQEVIRENWDFYAGKTTFIDTIVIPTTGFVANRIPLNCDYINGTPEIAWVRGPTAAGGPYVPAGGGSSITIQAIGASGLIQVPNPDYNPALPPSASNPSYINRDHGFGTGGSVTVGGTALTINAWAAGTITATVPASVTTGQLIVTRNDTGLSSVVGVTLHVADGRQVIAVQPPSANCDPYTDATQCQRIQPAINSAAENALILIAPGYYQEQVIMYKPQQLQGWGSGSTILDNTLAIGNFPQKDAWNTLFQSIVEAGTGPSIDLTPGTVGGFTFEQGAGIMVSACEPTQHGGSCVNQFTQAAAPMIDGMAIILASEQGGGIYVNSYAPYLQISNNEIYGNQGSLSGGIRVGTSSLTNGTTLVSSHNENMKILRNRIANNGSLQSGGGGISLYKGADNYDVSRNLICGNFSILYGGGIEHFGLSPNGLIEKNVILSNESFDEGGGIMIAGELVPTGSPTGTLTEGSGSVTINDNLIQGNLGGDDGGGIRTLMTNGQDVAANRTNPARWYTIDIFNNMIVNNASGDHGGGLSFDDSPRVFIMNNTIAYNDSTATGSGAFGAGCVVNNPPGQTCPEESEAVGGITTSIPRVGGIAAYQFSTGLQAVLPAGSGTYVNPTMANNIIWRNRSFYWDAVYCNQLGGLRPDVQGLCGPAENPVYWDLAVYPPSASVASPFLLSPTYSILTASTGARPNATNRIGTDPLFVKQYLNLYQATSKGAAFGNFVQVTFLPNGLTNSLNAVYGDYHITANSPAINRGTNQYLIQYQQLPFDYDGQRRPNSGTADIGADERYPTENLFPW